MRHIVWDMGGTLIDTYPELDRVLCRAVHGRVTDAELREVSLLTRRSTSTAIAELAERHGIPEQRLTEAHAELKQRWRSHPAPLMDGARELLDAVHAAGRLNLVVTHRDRRSALDLLEALGLLPTHPDDLVCPGDGFPRKPDPAMFHEMLRRHDLDPGEVLAVGDRLIDGQGATAAGIESVLLVTPGLPVADPAVPQINHLSELLALG